eukprot:GHUV01020938.1.p1 GENE.GHUV01020938.1~~GHUV01020938.1.p1  ORF type:complete len:645 (+),score=182.60 GHUV01020938.1:242-2176(+)
MLEQAYISKWLTFAASCFIMASAGLSYSFSVYAPSIKDTLGLSQTEIATVGSAVNLGGYFAIISGSVYDMLKDHHRLGPRLVVWLGCLCCFCGYMGMYLMASGKAPSSFPELLVFAIAAGNSGTWFDTSALVSNVRNFPNNRGLAVGVLKSFLGLSSSIYTSIYVALFEPDAVRFLLMLAIVPPVLALLLSMALNYVPFVEVSEGHNTPGYSWASTEGRFLLSFMLVSVLALYQMASAVLVGQHEVAQAGKNVMLVGMALLLGLSAALPLQCGGWQAMYGHPYISTRESQTDEETARNGDEPGSPQTQQADRRHSPVVVHGYGATAHYRAVNGGSGSSSSRPGRAVGQSSSHHRSRSPVLALGRPRSAAHAPGGSHSRKSFPGSDADTAAEGTPLLPGGAASASSSVHDGKAAALLAGDSSLAGSGSNELGSTGAQQDRQLHMGSLATGQMLCTVDFWLLFSQFVVGSGVCLAYLNNLGQLVVSLGGDHDGQVVFVSLFSVANAAGRLIMGYIPEQHLHARGTPRTMFLTLTAALTAASCLAVAYANLSHLYVISILLGLAFGAHWSLLPSITSDLFGLKHFAANYTTLQVRGMHVALEMSAAFMIRPCSAAVCCCRLAGRSCRLNNLSLGQSPSICSLVGTMS